MQLRKIRSLIVYCLIVRLKILTFTSLADAEPDFEFTTRIFSVDFLAIGWNSFILIAHEKYSQLSYICLIVSLLTT